MPLAPRPRALVGRSHDLARLRSAIGLTGTPATVGAIVSGDAGIGKSRLVAELAQDATRAERRVVVGHCVGVGGATLAWLPFIEMVAELAQSDPDAVAATLAAHPALQVLRPGDRGDGTTDPGRVAEAVHALLSEAARERPLVVIVEDVHWADHSSRDLLTLLLTRGFGTDVSLVVTYRSDDVHRGHPLHEVLAVWTRLPLVARVELGPLPAAVMHDLVHHLDDAPDDPADRGRIVERADGNPFFAEELVATGDSWSTDLSRILRLRLDRLDDPARRVVRAASLAGRTLDPELLTTVVGLDPDDLDDALTQAIDHHILEPAGGDALRFRHALLGETLAEELLPGTRRRLHRAWIDALRAHPDLGSPADLARHAAATGDTATAASAAIEAGDEAMRIGGARDALRHYEAALGWIGSTEERRGRVTLAASRAARASGDQIRSLDLLEEGLSELPEDADPRVRAQMLVQAAAWYAILDLPGDALGMSRRAVSLLDGWRTLEDFDVLTRHLGVLVNVKEVEEGLRLSDEVTSRAEELGLTTVVAEARLHAARLLSQVDPERARADLLSTARDPHAPKPLRIPALLRLGTLERNAGHVESAYEHFALGAELADQRQRTWGPYGMENRLQAGRAAYELGRWSDAERLLTSPPHLPHPPRGFMEGALVELQVARGDDVDPGRLTETLRWWEVDVLLVVSTLGGLIDLLGRLDRVEELHDVVERGIDTLQRIWSPTTQAILRLVTLCTGQAADLAARGHDVSALSEQSDQHAEVVATIAAADDGLRVGPESRAWILRHAAERRRLAVALGSPAGADLVEDWRATAQAMAALPNVPEHARSSARLAEALQLVGRVDEARRVAEEARGLAEDLGARPVLDLLDELAEREPQPSGPVLTPREQEVLVLLDRGRTNGQIADALVISRKTASVHVSNILAKVGASTRGEAVSIARDRGWLG